MIRSEDLRVGNKLLFEWKHEVEVIEIHKDYFYVESEKYGVLKSTVVDLEPIKLTEETLLKCGFVKVNKLFYDDNTYINLYQFESCYISLDNYTNVFFDWIDKSVMGYETMYLHQLQILYFALTNNEL